MVDVAMEEAREAARAANVAPRLAGMLEDVAEDRWRAPSAGVSLDPYETVTAVISCIARATTLRQALVDAVQFHGDTDTVAALVGGVVGSQLTPSQVRAELPWHNAVVLPESDDQIAEAAEMLATVRAALFN
jgi:ADP-ribosylglycohydrolase